MLPMGVSFIESQSRGLSPAVLGRQESRVRRRGSRSLHQLRLERRPFIVRSTPHRPFGPVSAGLLLGVGGAAVHGVRRLLLDDIGTMSGDGGFHLQRRPRRSALLGLAVRRYQGPGVLEPRRSSSNRVRLRARLAPRIPCSCRGLSIPVYWHGSAGCCMSRRSIMPGRSGVRSELPVCEWTTFLYRARIVAPRGRLSGERWAVPA